MPEEEPAPRIADTEFDSLISDKIETNPPIDSSSNSNSNNSHSDRGDEVDTQDSTTYMDCVEGTQQSTNTNTSSGVSSSPAATASPPAGHSAEGGKKSKKDKKDKKRKHTDGDKDESAEDSAVVVAGSAVPSTGSTPIASGHPLSRTNSNNLATTVTVDGALPVAIEGGFKYKELPPGKKHKHKKSRQDQDAATLVDSSSTEFASKSAIIPVDMTAFGGPSFPFGDNSRIDIHPASAITATAGLDDTEDVGEAVEPAEATINHLQHVALKQAHAGVGGGGSGKNRSVTLPLRTVTDMLGNLPEDHTSISGPNLAALQNTVKKYGKN